MFLMASARYGERCFNGARAVGDAALVVNMGAGPMARTLRR